MALDILFADADPALRDIYHGYFTRRGLTIETAADGREYLRMLHERQPHISIIDIELFDAEQNDEWKLHLNEACMDTPVVIVTGDLTSEQLSETTGVAASRCFQKPYSFIALLQCVRCRCTLCVSRQHSVYAPMTDMAVDITRSTITVDA